MNISSLTGAERYCLHFLGVWLLAGFLLAGCQPGVPSEVLLPALTASPEPVTASPTSLPLAPSATQALPSATQEPTLEITDTPAAPPFKLCSPLSWETVAELGEIVSSPYDPPPPGSDERHQGVDFSHWSRKGHPSMQGEPVQSVLPGRVAGITINRLPYGNMVIVETPQDRLPVDLTQYLGMAPGDSLYLLYAHFDQPPEVVLSQEVSCGQVIGAVGSTGYNVVNPHLHLETRLGPEGTTFGSMAFYTTSATVEEMETYKRWRTGGEFKHFDPMKLFAYSHRRMSVLKYLYFDNSSTIYTRMDKLIIDP